MKKHDEGYVLTLVLVVILVLCLVSSAILGGALSNINAQYGQIEKMQSKYTAAGAIEILVSRLENDNTWNTKPYTEDGIRMVIDNLCTDQGNIERYPGTEDGMKSVFADLARTYTFTVTAKAGEQQVTARLKLTLTVSTTNNTILFGKIDYVSYETGEVETT